MRPPPRHVPPPSTALLPLRPARALSALALAVALAAGLPGAAAAELQAAARLRAEATPVQDNPRGPLAAAQRLQPGIAEPADSAALQAELRLEGVGVVAVGTLRHARADGDGQGSAWVNELYAAGGEGAWLFSAGRRIVAWDVGHGFRPNDVVQQEARRQLLDHTAEGRPLLMAEYFGADWAAGAVWVNPTQPRAARGAGEPALAARLYWRDGALDWHGMARWGRRTGGSLGAALAWVAGDALELHASGRAIARLDTLHCTPCGTAVLGTSPWPAATRRHTAQWLVGGSWTHADQWSLLLEAWRDGGALSAADWRQWHERNQALARIGAAGPTPLPAGTAGPGPSPAGSAIPAAALAGNLAWQTDALGAAANLQRNNLFARLSWQHQGFTPAVDLLVTPADGGRVLTLSLAWQGDRTRVDAAWRRYGGPADAVLAQLPTRTAAFVALTLMF